MWSNRVSLSKRWEIQYMKFDHSFLTSDRWLSWKTAWSDVHFYQFVMHCRQILKSLKKTTHVLITFLPKRSNIESKSSPELKKITLEHLVKRNLYEQENKGTNMSATKICSELDCFRLNSILALLVDIERRLKSVSTQLIQLHLNYACPQLSSPPVNTPKIQNK